MANKCLYSGATGSADGSSWANAYTTLAAAVAGLAAGDTLFVSSSHAESIGGSATTITFPGTAASPNKVIAGTPDGTNGLTAVATGATITLNGTSGFTLNGSFSMEAVRIAMAMTGSVYYNIGAASGNVQRYKSCDFAMTSSAASSYVQLGSTAGSAGSELYLDTCRMRFGATGQFWLISRRVKISSLTVESGGTTPTGWLDTGTTTRPISLDCENIDLSNWGTGFNIIKAQAEGATNAQFHAVKLPTSWSGVFSGGTIKAGSRHTMTNYMIGSSLYDLWAEGYSGSIKPETVIKPTADAYSYKVVSNANLAYPAGELVISKTFKANAGAAATYTFATLTDGVTLTNENLSVSAAYYDTASSYHETIASSAPTDTLTAASNLTSSSASWTTTGLTTPVAQELAVTITPAQSGYVTLILKLQRASTTVYVKTAPTVS